MKKCLMIALASLLFFPLYIDKCDATPLQWSIDDGGNGHYYDYVKLGDDVTWEDANIYAQSLTYEGMSGYLASITSAEEDSFVASAFTAEGYLSGNDYEQTGIWVWEGGPDDGIIFQTGFGTKATRTTDFLSTSEPNGDGHFLWYYAFQDGTSWVNDRESYRGGAFIEYSSAAPVPEPATFILLGSGLAGLAFYRRKRK